MIGQKASEFCLVNAGRKTFGCKLIRASTNRAGSYTDLPTNTLASCGSFVSLRSVEWSEDALISWKTCGSLNRSISGEMGGDVGRVSYRVPHARVGLGCLGGIPSS